MLKNDFSREVLADLLDMNPAKTNRNVGFSILYLIQKKSFMLQNPSVIRDMHLCIVCKYACAYAFYIRMYVCIYVCMHVPICWIASQ
jgi:hypothetical protein